MPSLGKMGPLAWSKAFGYRASVELAPVPCSIHNFGRVYKLGRLTSSLWWVHCCWITSSSMGITFLLHVLMWIFPLSRIMGFVVSLCFNASKPFSGQNHWGHWDGVVDVHEMPRPRLCYQHKENMRTCFCNLFDLQPGKGRGDWASMIHTHDTCNYLW